MYRINYILVNTKLIMINNNYLHKLRFALNLKE